MIRRPLRTVTLRAMIAAAALAVAATSATAQNFSDSYVFLNAVKDADGDKVTKALQGGATIINTHDYRTGETALHLTIKRHDMTWTSFLLGRGADPNQHDGKGDTPLHVAAFLGFVEGAELLLGNDAQINATNSGGETPLIIAVQQRDTTMVRMLLNHGADPKQADHITGKSARDYASDDPRAAAVLRLIDESKTEVKAKPKSKMAGPKL